MNERSILRDYVTHDELDVTHKFFILLYCLGIDPPGSIYVGAWIKRLLAANVIK